MKRPRLPALRDLAVRLVGDRYVARAILAVLPRTTAAPRLVAAGDRLARLLRRASIDVVTTTDGNPACDARALAVATYDALCFTAPPAGGASALRAYLPALRPGGVVALAVATPPWRRTAPDDLTALLLHAGLRDLEQRAIGPVLLTTGRVHGTGA